MLLLKEPQGCQVAATEVSLRCESVQQALAAVDSLQTELLALAEENKSLHSELKEARHQLQRHKQQLGEQTEDLRVLCVRLQDLLSNFEANHQPLLSNCVSGEAWTSSGSSNSALVGLADLLRLKLHGAVADHLAQDRRAAADAQGAAGASADGAGESSGRRRRPLPLVDPQPTQVRRQQERFAELLQRNEQLRRQNESLAQQNALMLQQQAQFHRQQQLWLEQVQPRQAELSKNIDAPFSSLSSKRLESFPDSPPASAWGVSATATFDKTLSPRPAKDRTNTQPRPSPLGDVPSQQPEAAQVLSAKRSPLSEGERFSAREALGASTVSQGGPSAESARSQSDALLLASESSRQRQRASLTSPLNAVEAAAAQVPAARLSPAASPSSSMTSSRR